jgi:hypothetical protein
MRIANYTSFLQQTLKPDGSQFQVPGAGFEFPVLVPGSWFRVHGSGFVAPGSWFAFSAALVEFAPRLPIWAVAERER